MYWIRKERKIEVLSIVLSDYVKCIYEKCFVCIQRERFKWISWISFCNAWKIKKYIYFRVLYVVNNKVIFSYYLLQDIFECGSSSKVEEVLTDERYRTLKVGCWEVREKKDCTYSIDVLEGGRRKKPLLMLHLSKQKLKLKIFSILLPTVRNKKARIDFHGTLCYHK